MTVSRNANWIWTPDWSAADDAQARLVCFRKTLFLSRVPERFSIRITADTRYKLYVNGSLVQFGPSKGDSRVWYVDEAELAPWLRTGENVLAVSVLRYPADGQKGNHSLFRTNTPGLYLEGPDGWRCAVDRGTAFYAEDARFSPLWIHENAAADAALIGWKEPGYDDSRWLPACERQSLSDVLLPERLVLRTIPYMEQTPGSFALPLTEIPAHSEQRFVLDAGEEMCAFLRLTLSGGKGATVELLQSECYVTEHGKGDRLDAVHGHLEGYTDTYLVAGAENETYAPYWFRAFRFLQVTVRTGAEALTLRALDYAKTGYPLAARTAVRTSDESLAAVWDISLRTLRNCMHETYMDCPFYEQLQYAMDTRLQILYTYAVSADDRLARKAIDDFSRALRPDGLINCSYPNMNTNVIPGFSVYYILMLHDHMMYFGDKALVRRYLPAVHRILQFFDNHRRADGLVDKVGGVNERAPFWSFIDWAHEWLPTTGMPAAGLSGPLTMESLLALLGLQKAAELCEWVGDGRAAEYRTRAQALQSSVRAHCTDAQGMLTDGPGLALLSQHTQVFGILTGTLDPEAGRRNLLRTIRDRTIPQCTVAMCYYLFRAMEQTGLYEYTDQYWDIWRRMIADGCTTCVESEGYARSECHAWGALALYELPNVILGVRPASPGYETISVEPHPGRLRFADGLVHTPKGDLRVAWEKRDGAVTVKVAGDPDVLHRIAAK